MCHESSRVLLTCLYCFYFSLGGGLLDRQLDAYPFKPPRGLGIIAIGPPEDIVARHPHVSRTFGRYTWLEDTRYAVLFLQNTFWPKDVPGLKNMTAETGFVAMPVPYFAKIEAYNGIPVVRKEARKASDPNARAFFKDQVMMRCDELQLLQSQSLV
jgi:hypothetical protein